MSKRHVENARELYKSVYQIESKLDDDTIATILSCTPLRDWACTMRAIEEEAEKLEGHNLESRTGLEIIRQLKRNHRRSKQDARIVSVFAAIAAAFYGFFKWLYWILYG